LKGPAGSGNPGLEDNVHGKGNALVPRKGISETPREGGGNGRYRQVCVQMQTGGPEGMKCLGGGGSGSPRLDVREEPFPGFTSRGEKKSNFKY